MYPKITGKEQMAIALRIKNRLDISDLIKERDIRGFDLSRAVIKDFTRIHEDLSNCCFADAKIGEENRITNLMGCNLTNCNFKGVDLIGQVWLRRVKAINTNFSYSNFANVYCEHADFTGANFCGCLARLNNKHYRGAKFDEKYIIDFCKILNYDVKLKRIE